jgi:hypothetical protein
MLSFQITNSGRGIQVYCDQEGIATLIGSLEKLPGARWSHPSAHALKWWP